MDVVASTTARRRGDSGAPAALAVLLWVFVGWPLSWLLLFLSPPLGILFGVGITVGMILVVTQAGRRRPVLISPEQVAIRRVTEGLAYVDAVGGCGWCGSPWAHVDAVGTPVHPRYWHATEIEDRISSHP